MQTRIDALLNVHVRWDAPSGTYVSYAPALDIYSQGETERGALRAIEGAMRMYLVTALETEKLGGVLKRFSEAVSGIGPELPSDQYIKVVHDGEHQIKAKLMPLESGRG
jgi:predicted RNase H-like HicB family nuclease